MMPMPAYQHAMKAITINTIRSPLAMIFAVDKMAPSGLQLYSASSVVRLF